MGYYIGVLTNSIVSLLLLYIVRVHAVNSITLLRSHAFGCCPVEPLLWRLLDTDGTLSITMKD